MSSKRPTQADVARAAGVTRGTVSLVLNKKAGGKVSISEETRHRVLQAAKNLGYAPNPIAQMLASGDNHIIGVFTYEPEFPNEEESDHHPYLIGIESEASRQDFNVLLFTRQRSIAKRTIYSGGMNSLRLSDGAILLGSYPDRDELKRLADENYPFVYIGRREVPGYDIDWVVADYTTASYEATHYLTDLGHRHLGLIGHSPDTEASLDKLQGCRQAVAEVDDANLVVLPNGVYSQPDQLKKMLARHNLTALICREMWITRKILTLLEAISVQVPAKLSLLTLSSGDAGSASTLRPTKLLLHRRRVGEMAVRTLINRLKDSACEPQQILVPCELDIGDTTAPVNK